jgi:hypothetical protein
MRIDKRCKECGVPFGVGKINIWRDNGTIMSRRIPDHRMIFFESDNLDSLFRNVEMIVGKSIQEMVIKGKSKATREFLRPLIRGRRGRILRIIGYNPAARFVAKLGGVMGYGKIEVLDISPKVGRPNRMTIRVRDAYCLPLLGGDFLGSAEAAEEPMRPRRGSVDFLQEKENQYRMTVFVAGETIVERERPVEIVYTDKPGNIGYERCSRCGTPLDVARFQWDLEKGIILNPDTGRRMALFGPDSIERVFLELEGELGADIEGSIVEAQRRYTVEVLGSDDGISDEVVLRKALAIRGLGNLVSMATDREGVELRIENPCLTPLLAGLLLGGYEATTKKSGKVTWQVDPGGDLLVSIQPSG